ncbi:MAG: hypothetical protein OXD49_17275 [Candidatus Poribacteria bacterium]|nr:hypothetical protein [Candidatus Poribacteria bacterium]
MYSDGESQDETFIDDVEVFDKGGSSLAVEPYDKLTLIRGMLKTAQ